MTPPSKKSTKVIILGLGGMGSSAAYHFAKNGFQVLGFDQYGPPHDKGSSFGASRIIRQAYFEDPRYIPLLKKSYRLWDELQGEGYPDLFHKIGLLVMSNEEGGIPDKIQKNAKEHEIQIERLDASALKKRFPQFSLSDKHTGLFEPNAGYVLPEKTISAQLKLAQKYGAKLHFNETIHSWKNQGQSISVSTASQKYEADYLCLCLGPWSSLPSFEINFPLRVARAPQFWFEGGREFDEKNGMPCFAFAEKNDFIYGFPKIEGFGIKVASYIPGQTISNLETLDRNSIQKEETNKILPTIKTYLPGLSIPPTKQHLCLYTLTPDENFLIGKHPKFNNVFVATGGSGHAFKFVPLIGDLLVKELVSRPDPDAQFLCFRN